MFQCKICTNQIPDYDMNIYCKECRDRIKKDKEKDKEKELTKSKSVFEDGGFESLKKIFKM